MENLSFMFADWWTWFVSIYYGIDRLWLGAGIAASVLLGTFAAKYVEDANVIWRAVVIGLVSIGAFVLFLALAQLNPTFFDAGDLARSQVSA